MTGTTISAAQFLKRHFPFVLGTLLVLLAVGLHAWAPFSNKETNLAVVAGIVLIAVVIAGTYAIFLLVERREMRHAIIDAVRSPAPAPRADLSPPADPEVVVPTADVTPRVADVLRRIPQLVTLHPEIAAVALVGSWARGAGTEASDIDLVVIATDPTALLATDDWHRLIDERAELVRSSSVGALSERRLRRPDGLEIEVGIGAPGWLAINPMYPGTAKVLAAGAVAVYDPRGVLRNAIERARTPVA